VLLILGRCSDNDRCRAAVVVVHPIEVSRISGDFGAVRGSRGFFGVGTPAGTSTLGVTIGVAMGARWAV